MSPVRAHVRSQIAWIAMMDVACLVLGSAIGISLRLGHDEFAGYVSEHIDGWLLLFGAVILGNYLAGSYRLQYTYSRFNLVVTWLFSLLFALLILSTMSYAWFAMVLGRGVLILTVISYSVLALFLKLLVYRSLFRSEALVCRTVVLGIGPRAWQMRAILEHEYVLPAHRVVACIAVEGLDSGGRSGGGSEEEIALRGSGPAKETSGRPLRGAERLRAPVSIVPATTATLGQIVQGLGARLLVVGFEDLREVSRLYAQLKRLRFGDVEVLMPLSVAEIYSGRTPLDLIDEEEIMDASLQSSLPMYRRAKRVGDVLTSLAALVLLAPLAAIVALVVKLSDLRSPVIYSQDRVGQFGARFRIYKFRTMRHDAEAVTGPVWATEDDPRITRVGRLLRKTRLDEIPQLINILKGHMSLVGPRPERPEITARLAREIPWYEERENLLPGLTGWAQIQYPYGSSVDDARRKLEYDLYYLKHMSLTLDLQIMLRTVRIVLLGMERERR